jgi:hypothetical protein
LDGGQKTNRSASEHLVRKSDRPTSMQDNIKPDLRGSDVKRVDWIHMTHDSVQWRRALIDMVTNPRLQKCEKFFLSTHGLFESQQ